MKKLRFRVALLMMLPAVPLFLLAMAVAGEGNQIGFFLKEYFTSLKEGK